MVDDLGWKDAGVLGSEFYDTPAIDALAASGVRFSRFYSASPVCSPTRASLMTGRHPARVGITNWIGGEQQGMLLQADYLRSLPLEEVTLGEAFADAGYATGYIGKWHLGAEDEFLPEGQGFAWTRAVNRAGQPGSYLPPYRNEARAITDVPDLAGDPPDAYLTDRLTDKAIGFLEENRGRPFLLVLSHYAVHTPLQAPEADVAPYRERASALPALEGGPTEAESGRSTTKLRQDHPVYAGMVAAGDRGDRAPTANRPLRAGKRWLYEGGIRIPLIVRWPDGARGGRVSRMRASTTDVFPTLLEMAGLPLRSDQHVDGVSLVPFLSGEPASEGRDLFWHFPHYHGSGNRPSGALLAGDYKLVEWFEDGTFELYDLASDPGEAQDLSPAMPELTRDLSSRLSAWRDSVGARMPRPDPDWIP